MRLLTALAFVFALNSCNTFIGLGRDTEHAYHWTKNKIQGGGSGGGGGDVAPTY